MSCPDHTKKFHYGDKVRITPPNGSTAVFEEDPRAKPDAIYTVSSWHEDECFDCGADCQVVMVKDSNGEELDYWMSSDMLTHAIEDFTPWSPDGSEQ